MKLGQQENVETWEARQNCGKLVKTKVTVVLKCFMVAHPHPFTNLCVPWGTPQELNLPYISTTKV